MQDPEKLSNHDFFEKLHEGSLTAPTILTGMGKESEDDKDSFQFAPVGKCDQWVKMPKTMLHSARLIRKVPCKDHSHSVVEFKLSDSKIPEVRALMSLINLLSNNPN